MHACAVGCSSLTCTMAAMSMGSMASGNRRILKREMDVKAFSAVNKLSELTPTNVAKEARETCKRRRVRTRKKTIHDLLHLSHARLIHSTHQSRSTAEDEGRDRRQVGKLPHDFKFFPPDVFNLCLEGWLPCIQLQNLEGSKNQREGQGDGEHCGEYGKGKVEKERINNPCM